jgi:carotenoid cleavage dioxygenase-like enzyme
MDSIDLPVQGNIPPWLHGSLLRIGPSWFGDNPSKASVHWFDGLSMLHAFEIKSNRILYYVGRKTMGVSPWMKIPESSFSC